MEHSRKEPFIRRQIHFDSTDSTNTRAHQLAEVGAEEGTIVTAAMQTGGRGQGSRHWLSPGGQGLYYSIILRPRVRPDKVMLITLMAGIAVFETLRVAYPPVMPGLKWPNDVLIDGRKVAGILTECSWLGADLSYVIIGVGINLVWQAADFPPDLDYPATAMNLETERRRSVQELVSVLSDRLDLWYRRFLAGGSPELLAHWSSRSPLLGQTVSVETTTHLYQGTLTGLSTSGALLLELADGETIEINSGRIRLPTQTRRRSC